MYFDMRAHSSMSNFEVWQDLFAVVASFGVLGIATAFLFHYRSGRPVFAEWSAGAISVSLVLALVVPLLLPQWIGFSRGSWQSIGIAAALALASAIAAVLVWWELLRLPAEAGQAGMAWSKADGDLMLARELDNARRRLRELSSITGDWFWQSDANGRLTYLSDGARTVFGVDPGQLTGWKLLDLGVFEQDGADKEQMQTVMQRREIFRNLPLTFRRADGQKLLILLAGTPRTDESGDFCGYSGVGTDSTAENNLREARATAKAKDAFFAAMSHEIRTPLNGVLGLLEVLGETSLDAAQRKLVMSASHSGDALLHIVNDLLDFSKLEAGRFEIQAAPCDLSQVIGEAVNTVRPLVAKQGSLIEVDGLAALPPLITIDANRYRQILLNFLSNAVKFTKAGKIRIVISVEQGRGEPPNIRTKVIDTGPGISSENQMRLFRDFSMLADRAQINTAGTGLGLALCRKMAAAMGGDVGVESEVGKGSTFWFVIPFEPCAESQLDSATPATPAAASAVAAGRRILLAEDNPTNVLVATQMLGGQGHSIVEAEDGVFALEAFQRDVFDIILMDVSMPRMDGVEAALRIRRIEKEKGLAPTPIIALTAHAVPSERERIMAAGVTELLTKPVRKKDLLAELAKYPVRAPAQTIQHKVAKATTDKASAVAIRADQAQPAAAQLQPHVQQTTHRAPAPVAQPRPVTQAEAEPKSSAQSQPQSQTQTASQAAPQPPQSKPQQPRVQCVPQPQLQAGAAPQAAPAANRKSNYRDEPVLELGALERLADDVGADALPGLLQVFANEVGKRMGELQSAKQAKDVQQLQRTCHAMAGSTSTLGAMRLHKLCKTVEEACVKRPDVKYIDIVDIIALEVKQLIALLVDGGYIQHPSRDGMRSVA